MKYFAYGSNMSMSLARLVERTPTAVRLGTVYLEGYALKFHKVGVDGSSKCDACFTGTGSRVYGALFEIEPSEKPGLDRAEGLDVGYVEKQVEVVCMEGRSVQAFTYCAIHTDASLQPYTWYLNHVLVGARESRLPADYIEQIEAVPGIEDDNPDRDRLQRAIHHLRRPRAVFDALSDRKHELTDSSQGGRVS